MSESMYLLILEELIKAQALSFKLNFSAAEKSRVILNAGKIAHICLYFLLHLGFRKLGLVTARDKNLRIRLNGLYLEHKCCRTR